MAKPGSDRLEWAMRVAVGAVALLSFALGVLVPGSIALAAGMLGFLLVPHILHLPVGVRSPFGQGVRYITGPTPGQRLDARAREIGMYAWLIYGGASLWGIDGMMVGVFAALMGNACALIALWGLGMSVFSAQRDAHAVTLDRATLTVSGTGGTHVIDYADLGEIEVSGNRIWLHTPADRHVVEVTGPPQMAEDIAAAIVDAKVRALRERKEETAGVKELERPSGMGAREWLARIDAVVAAGRDTGPYRGKAIDEDELWLLLGDDAADVAARAAAARVLASSENADVRVRVASSAKAIADEDARVRIELAMKPDAEEAAAEIEAFEMDELRKSAGV